MTYYELCENIRDLGFAEMSEIEEYEQSDSSINVISNSVNRAVTEINLSVAHIIGRYEFEIDDEDEGYLYIEMPMVAGDFMAFAETPVLIRSNRTNQEIAKLQKKVDDGTATLEDTTRLAKLLAKNELYTKFLDYDIEAGDTLVINQDINKGNFRVLYIASHEPVDETIVNAESDVAQTEIPLPLKAHHLVPLLASYYVWLDDDPTKASQYYNLYEQLRGEMLQTTKKLRGRIMSGGI